MKALQSNSENTKVYLAVRLKYLELLKDFPLGLSNIGPFSCTSAPVGEKFIWEMSIRVNAMIFPFHSSMRSSKASSLESERSASMSSTSSRRFCDKPGPRMVTGFFFLDPPILEKRGKLRTVRILWFIFNL